MQGIQQSHRSRIVLTGRQAAEIFRLKSVVEKNQRIDRRAVSRSRLVAEQYGVSPKTVRDIWNRKTWVFATMHIFLTENCTLDQECGHGSSVVQYNGHITFSCLIWRD